MLCRHNDQFNAAMQELVFSSLVLAPIFFNSSIAKAFEHASPTLSISSPRPIAIPIPIMGIAVTPLPDRRPRDQSITSLSAPSFWWPVVPGTGRWRLEILNVQHQAQSAVQIDTTKHWHNLKQSLTPGQYKWRVTPLGSTPSQPGAWFSFTVNNQAISPAKFVTFTPQATGSFKTYAKNYLLQSPVKQWRQRQQRNLDSAVWLVNNFTGAANNNDGILGGILLSNELYSGLEAIKSLSLIAALEADSEQCSAIIKKTTPLLAVAKNRAMQYQTNDQIARNIAWAIALLIERCPAAQEPTFKVDALQIIERYIEDAHRDIVASNRFAKDPLDSHGWTNLGFICGLAALTQNELIGSKARLADSLPLYINTFSPWGGEDGGFGNGSGYAYFAIAIQYEIWDVLAQTQTINFYQHPWLKSVAQYMTAMQPAGVKNGTFGNSSELASDPSVLANLIARLDTPFAANARASKLLQAPSHYAALSGQPIGVPSALNVPIRKNLEWFESSGEVVLHGHNTQVYFRSSPYGSSNHSHPDQNSFITNVNGKRMIGRSGVYDAYESRHYNEWYKTTAAQSGISIRNLANNSLVGQKTNSLASIGKITDVGESGEFAWALGSASKAQTELKRADRLIIFKQPNEWLTVDIVELREKHLSYQVLYNLHIPAAAIALVEDKRLIVNDEQTQFCAQTIKSPVGILGSPNKYSRWKNISNTAPAPLRYGERNDTRHFAYVAEPSQIAAIAILFKPTCSAPNQPLIKTTESGNEIHWDGVVWKLPKTSN